MLCLSPRHIKATVSYDSSNGRMIENEEAETETTILNYQLYGPVVWLYTPFRHRGIQCRAHTIYTSSSCAVVLMSYNSLLLSFRMSCGVS